MSMALQRGSTLIEVLVALAVVSAGTVAVLTLLSQAVAMRSAELQRMRIARLAADAGEIAAMNRSALAIASLESWAADINSSMTGVRATVAIAERDGMPFADLRIAYRDNRGNRFALQRDYAFAAAP